MFQHSLLNAQTKPSVVMFIDKEFLQVSNILINDYIDVTEQQLKYPNAFDPFIVL